VHAATAVRNVFTVEHVVDSEDIEDVPEATTGGVERTGEQ
jgi:hypothetical protein